MRMAKPKFKYILNFEEVKIVIRLLLVRCDVIYLFTCDTQLSQRQTSLPILTNESNFCTPIGINTSYTKQNMNITVFGISENVDFFHALLRGSV